MPTCFLRVQTGVNNFSPLSVPLRLFCNLSEVPHEHGSKGNNLTPCRNRQQNHQPEIKGSCLFWKNKINKLLCAREFPVCGRILARFFLQQSVCAVLNLALCSEQTTKPQVTQFEFTVHSPWRPRAQYWDSEKANCNYSHSLHAAQWRTQDWW